MTQTTRTAKKEAEFLQALATGLTVSGACLKVNVPRATAYDWRKRDGAFAAAWDEAIEAGGDALEDEVLRRGKDGVDKGIYYQGARVDTVREYSDNLLMFHLKSRRPEKYRDNVNLTGNLTATITIEESLRQANARAKEKARA